MKNLNIVSFGISSFEDVDMLHKQYELCTKYFQTKFNFIVIPGREQYKPDINLIPELEKELSTKYNFFNPSCLNNNNNINQNTSIFTGFALSEFFNSHQNGQYFLLHLDCLPITPLCLSSFVKNYPLLIVDQRRQHVVHAWDNIFYIDLDQIQNCSISFNCNNIDGVSCDTGGETAFLLRKFPYISVSNTQKYLNSEIEILKLNLNEKIKNILLQNYFIQLEEMKKFGSAHWSEIFMDNSLFHYRSFSGWHRQDEYTKKIKQQRKKILLEL